MNALFGWENKKKLEKKLEAERESEKLRKESEAKQREADYANERRKDIDERTKKAEDEKQEEMKKVRDDANKELNKMNAQLLEDSSKIMEKVEDLDKIAREEQSKQLNEINQSTGVRIKELNEKDAKTSENISKTELELEKAAEDKRNAKLEMNEETMQLQLKHANDRRMKNEEHFEQILDNTNQVIEAHCEAERSVNQLKLEHFKKEQEDQKELFVTKASSHRRLLDTQIADIEREKMKEFDQQIDTMKKLNVEIKNGFDKCVRYLGDDFKWKSSHFERAEKYFDKLDTHLGYLADHFVAMVNNLKDIPEESRRLEMAEKLRVANGTQGEFKTCVAEFSGKLMNGKASWSPEDVDVFKQLQHFLHKEINAIQSLDSVNKNVLCALKPTTSHNALEDKK